MQATPGQGKRVNLRGGVVEEAHRAVSALPRGEGSGGIPGGRRDRRRLLAEIRQHLMRPAHHGAIFFSVVRPGSLVLVVALSHDSAPMPHPGVPAACSTAVALILKH
jgi:hypothetical protein